jgi:hypothetical protein
MPQSYVRVRFLHHHHRQACRPSSENRSVFCPCRRGLITVTSPGISTERDSHAHLTSCMLSEYVRDTWLALCRSACPDGRGCRATRVPLPPCETWKNQARSTRESTRRSGEFLSSLLPRPARGARSELLHGLSRDRERKQMGAKGERLDLGNIHVPRMPNSSNRRCLSHDLNQKT